MPSSVTIEGIEFTRYIQSAFKIKAPGLTIWVDPHRVSAREVGEDRADLILITHPHNDHLDLNSIEACKKEDTVIVCSPACLPRLEGRAARVVQLGENQSTEQKAVPIKAVPAYNDFHKRAESFGVGFLFTLQGRQIYHAGDTGKVEEMADLGPVDIALIPIGGFYTVDEAEAADAVRTMIKPRAVIPMHYGYATGGDPQKFRDLVGGAATVHILDPVLEVKWGQ
jgi:L-ascorbate metabolism protein UlaG (beta-lactamase superfamily)